MSIFVTGSLAFGVPTAGLTAQSWGRCVSECVGLYVCVHAELYGTTCTCLLLIQAFDPDLCVSTAHMINMLRVLWCHSLGSSDD